MRFNAVFGLLSCSCFGGLLTGSFDVCHSPSRLVFLQLLSQIIFQVRENPKKVPKRPMNLAKR